MAEGRAAMAEPVRIERDGDVLLAIADNPPVNALGAEVRRGLLAALRAGEADPGVSAVIVLCEGRTFFSGADVREFGAPMAPPLLPEVVDAIEESPKPVVAAIHGAALGGGCEVALACHYRIAVPSARLGTPEVKLGLVPGAGGTQRLPRLVGAPMALRMVALGDAVPAREALACGLIDRLSDEDRLRADAVAFARSVAGVRPPPRAGQRPAAPDADAVPAFRAAHARRLRGLDAPEAAIACVEKAIAGAPLAEGLAFERAAFLRLLDGAQSAALRHLFFAERQAAKIDGVGEEVAPRPVARVGIVGAGTMGGGIAMNFLSAGIPVTIVERDAPALTRGVDVIRRNYDASAARGRMDPDAVERAMARLTPTLGLDDLAGADLVIEAVFEQMDVKLDLFARLDRIARPGAILASNTSYLDIDAIAAVTGRPQDVLGLHFFSPANVMKLLEVVRGARTAPDVLRTAMTVARTIGKVAVVAGVCDGFIGNRMLKPRQVNALDLLLEGATPEQIDRVHEAFGMPMGPFRMADLAGVDIGWHRDPARVESIRDALCAAGRWGQKTAKGFYDYDAERRAAPSAEAQAIIDGFAARAGRPRRAIGEQEIIERTLYPLVAEGYRILEEGIAQRASDIDVVWVHGYGWPAWRGGPMFWAEREGREAIAQGLERHGLPVAASLRAAGAKARTPLEAGRPA
jgi:3-hydroxyacyl-CoA dehydrogenase